MKKKCAGFIGLLLILAVQEKARAGAPLETPPALSRLVAEALANNHDIKAMEEMIRALRAKASFDGALADPQIGFSLSNLPVDSFDFKEEPMTQKQVFLAQTFPWPGKRGLKSRATDLEAQKMEQSLKAGKLSLAATLAGYYYELGRLGRSLDVNRTTTRLIDKMLQVAETRYTSGKGNRQDILMARIERDKRISERLDLSSRYRQTESRIYALLNRDGGAGLSPPPPPEPGEAPPPSAVLIGRAFESNPSMALLRLEQSRGEAQKALSEKAYYPDVNVKLTYGQRDDDPMGRSRSDFLSLGASFPIPLWKNQRQDRDLAFREASLQSAAHKLMDLKARLPHDIDRLTADISDTLRRYHIYKDKLIPSARDMAGSAQSDYEVGQSEFGPMISAHINALSMELSADKLLFDLAQRRAELGELLGTLLDEQQGNDHDRKPTL